MRNLFFIYLLLVPVSFLSSQRKFEIKIQSEGRTREAIISVPTTPPPSTGYPIVFMCHGTSGNANNYYAPIGWKELGQNENFITIFPSALTWCYYDLDEGGKQKNLSRFVCGDLLKSICPEDTARLISDIFYFRKLVQLVEDTVKINKSKIFMSGFSNGCSMAHKISMDATDLFSASGGSSAPLSALDSTTPAKRIPMLFMVGTLDDRFFSEKFPTALPFGGDSILIYLKANINRALVCQGLTEKYTKTETPISHTYTWSECRPGEKCAPYVFMLNKDQIHEFPNGKNHPVDAPKILWDFYNNPPKTSITTALSAQSKASLGLNMYPNPASEYVLLKTGQSLQPYMVNIYDQVGRLIVHDQGLQNEEYELNVRNWLPGLYVVQIMNAMGSQNKSLVIAK
jgi:poly(3-hydroxybutyrate) depolymerase